MKLCPHCRRDYHDDGLFFCLEDGAALHESVRNREPETAILVNPRSQGEIYEFDNFRLDPSEQTLLRDEMAVTIPPKVFATLRSLVENAGRLLDKEALMKTVWPDQFVEEGNLTYNIRMLRKALGDDAEHPRYIETVPRRGYRFIAQVRLEKATPARCSVRPARASGTLLPKRPGDLSSGKFPSFEYFDSPIIGRVKEITETRSLLETRGIRLITLTGPGGTGKTRLAREVARQIEDCFPDGVFFFDLTSLNDPAMVAPEIARALSITEPGTRQIVDVLADYFRGRSALLILDNFEQVITAGVQLVWLLRSTTGLKILVTSREPLKLTMETEYRVPPLGIPSSGTKGTIADIMRFEAIQLFVQRAKVARRDFELTDEDALALSGICSKLDGLPLALELAASRARVLSVQEIHSKLENRLALLTGGSRDMPDRQRTMRATIEWSYGILSESEKRVFALLSVFEGGFNFKAAERVLMTSCDREPVLSETGIVDAIASLTEKSLLLSERSPDGELRFRMLVVVRDYALEIRSQESASKFVGRAHAEYFLEFAEMAAPYLFSIQSPEWLNRFEVEDGNIRAAIRWALDNDHRMAARILAAVRHLAALRYHIRETRYWLEKVLEKSHDIPPHLHCEMLTGLGIICQYQQDFATARKAQRSSLDISRRLSDKKLIARALRGIGAIDYMELNLESAREHINEALAVSRSVNDEFGEAAALSRLADISNAGFDHAKARSLIIQALEMFKRLGYKQGVASKLANLSITEFFSGDYESARQCLREGLETSIEIDDQIDFRINFEVAAALQAEAGNYQVAARLSGMAAARCEDMAYFHEPVEQRFRETYLAKLKSAMGTSEFEAAFAAGRKMILSEAVELAREAATGQESSRMHLRLVGIHS